jgi:hypothetical protein
MREIRLPQKMLEILLQNLQVVQRGRVYSFHKVILTFVKKQISLEKQLYSKNTFKILCCWGKESLILDFM